MSAIKATSGITIANASVEDESVGLRFAPSATSVAVSTKLDVIAAAARVVVLKVVGAAEEEVLVEKVTSLGSMERLAIEVELPVGGLSASPLTVASYPFQAWA